jgi:type I restriction enzyme M protein
MMPAEQLELAVDGASLSDGMSQAEGEPAAEGADEVLLYNVLHRTEGDRLVKRTPKEEILQAAARSLIFEYGFDLADLERAFTVRLTTVSEATGRATTRRTRLDIAAFRSGAAHTQEQIVRAGVITPPGTRHDDDKRGVAALDDVLGALPNCEFGFWTNGAELAFRRRVMEGTAPSYDDVADMPAAGETAAALENQRRRRRLAAVTAETLAQTFRRCHDYIYGNQGLSRAQAFWEFLRLIFCKMYDEEREAAGRERRFWVGLTERFTAQGQRAIKERLTSLFEEVKGKGSVPSEYAQYFDPGDKIGLNEPVLAYVAGELARYDLLHSSEDAKGAAYEELIDRKQKADRGQFFTPRNVIRLMVAMLDPGEDDYILDPACGTGGFLVVAFRHVREKIKSRLSRAWPNPEQPTAVEQQALRQEVRSWAAEHLYGFDFDESLVKAAEMNLAMNGGAGRIYHLDSLKFKQGQTPDTARLVRELRERYTATGQPPIGELNTFTLCLTNPPFGSKIPFTDREALRAFDLARLDLNRAEGEYDYRGDGRATHKRSLPPEVLFVERCVQWVRPGGRVGIVLPDGILGNPKDAYIRRWVLGRCDVLASVDLPVETFLPQVGVQPSLLFLRKKTDAEVDAEALGSRPDRSVFMAIVDRVGKDRRGNVIYKRNPDGTDAPPLVRTEPRVAIRDGRQEMVHIRIEEPQVDDELEDVLPAWQRFQREATAQ